MRTLVALMATVLALSAALGQDDPREAPLVRVEAEDSHAMHGLQVIERAEASGGRTVSYWEDPGTWLELDFDLPVAGDYLITVRYALNWPDTRRVLLLDGEEIGEVELATTGSWGDFRTLTLPVGPIQLPAGTVTLRLLNRDSLGLSLDWAAMHSPQALLADQPLGVAEREALTNTMLEALGEDATELLSHGSVELHTGATGAAWAAIGGHLLTTARDTAAPGGEVTRHSTAHHQIAVVTGAARFVAAVSDGQSLHIIVVLPEPSELALPAPVLSADGLRMVRARSNGETLHLPAGEWRHEGDYLEAGGLHITAAPAMTVGPWDDSGLAPVLRLRTVECGAGHVGAIRYSTRWGTDQPRVGLERSEDACVVRESVQRFPTLATFYGEGLFDLTIGADGAINFEDIRSGESISLREAE